jgi:hypothetical protein
MTTTSAAPTRHDPSDPMQSENVTAKATARRPIADVDAGAADDSVERLSEGRMDDIRKNRTTARFRRAVV